MIDVEAMIGVEVMIDVEVEIEVDMEIETEITVVDVEGKFLMENSEEPTIAWWWRIFPQEPLGRT